jgi:hypothetical protein
LDETSLITRMSAGTGRFFAVARPVIRDEPGISLVMMGWFTFAFGIACALLRIPRRMGSADRFGVRRGSRSEPPFTKQKHLPPQMSASSR